MRGRPRKFKKETFLRSIRAGKTKVEACKEQGVCYSTLNNHLRSDRYFRGKVAKASYEQKLARCAEKFKKINGRTLVEIVEERKKAWQNPYAKPCNIFEERYGKAYGNSPCKPSDPVNFQAICLESHLYSLAERNQRGWGPIYTRIKKWLQYANPAQKKILCRVFIDVYKKGLYSYGEPIEISELENLLPQLDMLDTNEKFNKLIITIRGITCTISRFQS
jgi:hypothetical protein